MEKASLNYSLKNIPIPSKDAYTKQLYGYTESFIQRMRWRAFHFLKDKDDDDCTEQRRETYGFNTAKSAKPIPLLRQFEDDLIDLISNIEFRKHIPPFQRKLLADVKKINNSDKLFVPADKSANVYEVEMKTYTELLESSIQSDYKKDKNNSELKINSEAKTIAERLNISDLEIETIANTPAYITLKDHKENFASRPKTRLINPAKSDVGRVAKIKLEEINEQIRTKTKLTQWKNTDSVIDWFNSLEQKKEAQFCVLDIVNFYPSISEKLFNEALNFASQYTPIDDITVKTIANSCQSLLYYENEAWVKQSGLFDVTMGAYMGAQVCDLVGLYLLHQIDLKFPLLRLGLYRDDGLGVTYSIPGPARERMKKDIIKVFKDNGLSITIDMGPQKVEFLDVILDLSAQNYGPYRKPNSTPRYINVQSNHPPTVLKQIPQSINKRLSKISSSKEKFDSCKNDYQQALDESGYRSTLEYDREAGRKQAVSEKKKRKRKITWWNPPFCLTVKTPIGRKFRNLIKKHFKKDNPLSKIFNKNTIKLSYSCTKNMESVIKGHTSKLMKKKFESKEDKKMCNCRGGKTECPLDGKCLTEEIIYKAEIDGIIYYGSAGGTFKKRYYTHKHTFANRDVGQTALSTYVHDRCLNYKNIK